MAVYRRTSRPRFTLLLLVLTSVTVITLDYRGDGGGVDRHASRARRATRSRRCSRRPTRVFEPVGNFFNGVLHYGDLEDENARLREQLAEQRGQVAAGRRTPSASARRSSTSTTSTFARRHRRRSRRAWSAPSPSNFELTVEIDQGTNDGHRRGHAGRHRRRASSAGWSTCRARAPSCCSSPTRAPTSASGWRRRATSASPTATGRAGPRRRPPRGQSDRHARGEVVVTSGLQQSVFPPGIPVGVGSEQGLPRGPERKGVTLVPVVDLRPARRSCKVLIWPRERAGERRRPRRLEAAARRCSLVLLLQSSLLSEMRLGVVTPRRHAAAAHRRRDASAGSERGAIVGFVAGMLDRPVPADAAGPVGPHLQRSSASGSAPCTPACSAPRGGSAR